MSEALTNGPSPTDAADDDETLPTRSKGAAYLRGALRLFGRGRVEVAASDSDIRHQEAATGAAPTTVPYDALGEVAELYGTGSYTEPPDQDDLLQRWIETVRTGRANEPRSVRESSSVYEMPDQTDWAWDMELLRPRLSHRF